MSRCLGRASLWESHSQHPSARRVRRGLRRGAAGGPGTPSSTLLLQTSIAGAFATRPRRAAAGALASPRIGRGVLRLPIAATEGLTAGEYEVVACADAECKAPPAAGPPAARFSVPAAAAARTGGASSTSDSIALPLPPSPGFGSAAAAPAYLVRRVIAVPWVAPPVPLQDTPVAVAMTPAAAAQLPLPPLH